MARCSTPTTRRPLIWFVAAATACATAGCGEASLAPVRGSVTIDGEPATAGEVYFAPIAAGDDKNVGKQSYSKIGADGQYTLGTFQPGDGALIGRHRVSLVDVKTEASQGGLAFGRMFIPDQQFEVLGGEENVIDLELTAEMIRRHASRSGPEDD